MAEFNCYLNGHLHVQSWVDGYINSFHNKMNRLKQFRCKICNEMWPTFHDKCLNCKYNKDMDPRHDYLPDDIKLDFSNITMVEEMLISPILPFMTIYKLRNGQFYSSGFVVNYFQDYSMFENNTVVER